MADAADPIQSGDQCVASVGGQCVRGRRSLLKHSHQRIEVAFVLIAEVARKTGGLLAIEDHQLGHAGGVADGLLVIGNSLLCLQNGRSLPAEGVRPKPAIHRFFVGTKHILAQAEAGMQKRLIVLVGVVEILDQAQQGWPIKTRELRLDIGPPRL